MSHRLALVLGCPGVVGFEGRSSVRTWLYRIATTRSLNALRSARRLGDGATGPEARYQASEAISLAFITALQMLPPRQRAVLILLFAFR